MRTGFFVGMVSFLVSAFYVNADETYVHAHRNQASEQSPDHSNGLPNVSARFKPDSTDFDIFADLLVWWAKPSGAESWADVIVANGAKETCDLRNVRFGCDAGFRIGVGYGMRHDQWDTQLYYTWFHTSGKDRVSSSPGSVYSPFLGDFYVDNPAGKGVSGVPYQRANIDWTIRFNMFDWELGRKFWISERLSLRPFLGLKGGWIDQSIDTKWQIPDLSNPILVDPIPFNTARENLKNNFWGLGPCGGVDTLWNLFANQNHSFSLFGNLSGAIMYGHWTFGDVYKNDVDQRITLTLPHLNSGSTMLRTLLGFEWDANFSQDRYRFSTKLGYEMQFWLDQLQFYSLAGAQLTNVLTFQGGTLEFRFDF